MHLPCGSLDSTTALNLRSGMMLQVFASLPHLVHKVNTWFSISRLVDFTFLNLFRQNISFYYSPQYFSFLKCVYLQWQIFYDVQVYKIIYLFILRPPSTPYPTFLIARSRVCLRLSLFQQHQLIVRFRRYTLQPSILIL